MNRLDEQYRGLLGEVLYNGVEKEDRTGTGTYSRFGLQIKHQMSDGFPILTTKKIPINTVKIIIVIFGMVIIINQVELMVV